MTKDQIFEFFRRLAEDNPAPETELEYGNAYQLVVAVALSAQATDVGVNKATRALFKDVQTPQQMVELGEVIIGRHPGRTNNEQITVFESQGMAIQDLAVALRVLAAAEAQGLGISVPMQ